MAYLIYTFTNTGLIILSLVMVKVLVNITATYGDGRVFPVIHTVFVVSVMQSSQCIQRGVITRIKSFFS